MSTNVPKVKGRVEIKEELHGHVEHRDGHEQVRRAKDIKVLEDDQVATKVVCLELLASTLLILVLAHLWVGLFNVCCVHACMRAAPHDEIRS